MSRDECQHGSLRRKCAVCQRDEDLAEVSAERDRLRVLLERATVRLEWFQRRRWGVRMDEPESGVLADIQKELGK
jgi:hypothetical protein